MATFKANGLQWLVRNSLDGSTRNELFSVDPGSPDYVEPDGETNLYNFEVDNLGIIDLSLIPVVPTVGIRFVTSLWIYGVAPAVSGTVQIVDSITEKVMREVALATPAEDFLFVGRTIRVPQGASLRLNGWDVSGNPSDNLRVRLEVRPATSTRQWAQQLIASCCQNAEAAPFIPTPQPGPGPGPEEPVLP